MKITVLVENTCNNTELECEHGLSLYIEYNGQKILYDTGRTSMFYHNACKLGIDLSEVDVCVISHGHYDHGGGLSTFLEVNSKANIYISRYAFEPYYHGTKYIGIDSKLRYDPRFVFVDSDYKIGEIELIVCNDRETITPIDSCGLTINDKPDLFDHEIYLKIKDICFSGCSHKGIINIIAWLKPNVFVGGFHFKEYDIEKDSDLLCEKCNALMKNNTTYYTCHCTGIRQYEYIKKKMKNRLFYISTGDTIYID